MSKSMGARRLEVTKRLRRTVANPTPAGTPRIWWGTVQTYTATTVDVVMDTSDVVPGLPFDASIAQYLVAGAQLWGFAVGSDYYVAGVRKTS